MKLDNVLTGLVIARMGQLVPLSEKHHNFFVHDLETPVLDNATKKPLYLGQKPIKLLNDIISLYACKGDWVFSGPSEIGYNL